MLLRLNYVLVISCTCFFSVVVVFVFVCYSSRLTQMAAARDPDAIKLFVGQLPKMSSETDLAPFFEQYGPIAEFSILRDKGGISKGTLMGVGFFFFSSCSFFFSKWCSIFLFQLFFVFFGGVACFVLFDVTFFSFSFFVERKPLPEQYTTW